MKFDKIKLNIEKTKKLHKEFTARIKKTKVPCLAIGVISNKDGSPKFFEVIIKRPERYNVPGSVNLIPKKFKGFNVKVY